MAGSNLAKNSRRIETQCVAQRREIVENKVMASGGLDPGLPRCPWSVAKTDDEQYIRYHDEEWGVPAKDDRVLFEFLVLESSQAGLSWRTILRKRENYRAAFEGFDWEKVALFDEARVEALMQDAGIIRNRAKINAIVNNAKMFQRLREEFGSAANYFWQWFEGSPHQPARKAEGEIPAVTELATAIAADMKARGFKFFGPTTCYAHLQATGLVNDHLTSCFRYPDIIKMGSTHQSKRLVPTSSEPSSEPCSEPSPSPSTLPPKRSRRK